MLDIESYLPSLIVLKLVGPLGWDASAVDAEHLQRGCLWQRAVQRVEMEV